MPPGIRGGKRKRAAPPGTGRTSIDALPDDVLHHVLSYLPAQEAVWTCVLARRWRHLWRSATGLLISCDEDEEAESVKEIRKFVDNLLRLRRGFPLDKCELSLFGVECDDVDRVNLWIRRVLRCKVRDLILCVDSHSSFKLDRTFISQHLKKLQLSTLRLDDSTADFSSCPALEVLNFNCCVFSGCQRISSQSLKCLSLDDDCSYDENSHPRVNVPNLISLQLTVESCRTPLLQRMPSLVEAVVEICDSFCDPCDNGGCSCSYVYGITNECMLLQGLSEAQSLVLISDIKVSVFRRDLKWCPRFSNLKTLLLNEYWCMPPDFSLLTCILQHSPVLEKLTLQLFCKGPKSKVEMEGSPDRTETSNAISKNLKIVEVKCEVVDDRVLDVLKFLSKLSINSYRFQF